MNSAVFTEGSFCYIPKETICPLDLSTYFRINNIKNNKFVLRDYLGLINEIVYGIESKIENIDNQQEKQELDNKIDQLKSYKIIIKEYMNLNYTNHFDDNDLCIIYEDALICKQ